MQTLMRLALAGVLVSGAFGCDFNVNPLDGKPGSVCVKNSDCLSNYCAFDPYAEYPLYGTCSQG